MKIRKAKFILNAVIVATVSLALIMPSMALSTNEEDFNLIPTGATELKITERTAIDDIEKATMQTCSAAGNVVVSPIEGDDRLPAITVDQNNHVVISWTNEISFTETNFGLSYAIDPSDPQEWINNGAIYAFEDPNTMYFDVAMITDEWYTGLFGCFLAIGTESTGGFFISDITDPDGLYAYTWQGDALEPQTCEATDMDYLSSGVYYPDDIGPWNFYIYRETAMGFNIPQCPVFFRTFIDGSGELTGGVGFFDAQSFEHTSPADFPDYYVKGEDTIHTVVTNVENDSVIWKKIVPSEETDFEYTPYQDTIATGTQTQLAGNSDTIMIVYVNGGDVNAIYSDDDGVSWETTTIGSGSYPNICEYNGQFYVSYIQNNNLFVVSSDDGASWSEPDQVNDVDGSVVDEPKSVDIHPGGIVWVDDRGDDWDIYWRSLTDVPQPILTIDGIAGGLGVSATITNIGDAEATNVDWSITADGTVFVGGETTDTISSLAPGDSAEISSFLLGFGDVSISFDAVSDEGASASASASGKLLLFFLTGLE